MTERGPAQRYSRLNHEGYAVELRTSTVHNKCYMCCPVASKGTANHCSSTISGRSRHVYVLV